MYGLSTDCLARCTAFPDLIIRMVPMMMMVTLVVMVTMVTVMCIDTIGVCWLYAVGCVL